jgi:hypothetical protein
MKQNRRKFLRNSSLAAAAPSLRRVVLGEFVASLTGVEEKRSKFVTIRQEYQAPPRKYGSMVRWWWPGNYVTEEEFRREVIVQDQSGFGGAEIKLFEDLANYL